MKPLRILLGLAMLAAIPLGLHYLTRKPVQPVAVETEQVINNPPSSVETASELPDPMQKPVQQQPAPAKIVHTSDNTKTNDLIIVRMRGIKASVNK